MENTTPKEMTSSHLAASLYKDDFGQPLQLTPTQQEIFDIITKRKYPRTLVITPTQYGKSKTVATAVLTRAATFPEKWAIVAPTAKKAGIIMGYVIDHIFDNEYTQSKFAIEKGDSFDKIRRERSKERVNFRISKGRLGEVFTLTTEGKRTKNVLDALMGFGAANIVFDESALVEDEQYAGVKRMLGGHKDNFILEIGNPLRRNHFFQSAHDDNYNKIWIDHNVALREGRYSHDFVEEMRKEKYFSILYECKFPDEGMIDDSGWLNLFLTDDVQRNLIEDEPYPVGAPRLGVDPSGGGGNFTSMVMRFDNYAKVEWKGKIKDTMKIVERIFEICDKYRTLPGVYKHPDVFIDAVGIGKGVYDRAKEKRPQYIYGIMAGEKVNSNDYSNMRAQYYWRTRNELVKGLKLLDHPDWKKELTAIKYKLKSEKRIQIMPKTQMRVLGIESPDTADALGLTFAVYPETIEDYVSEVRNPTQLDPYEG